MHKMRIDDTLQTCQIETITNQMEDTLNKKLLLLVLIKLYTLLLPSTPRKWSSRELFKLNDFFYQESY